ncbi:MAG: ATP-binding protein [Betaproteobacteria bacterium]
MNSLFPTAVRPMLMWMFRGRRWIILAMLLSLHAGLLSDSGSNFQRIWLLVHFGLFLLWQPFISTDRELKVFALVMLFGITGVVLYSLAGWMLVTWVAMLIAIMGGKVFTLQAARRSRFYLVAVFYLFTVLLIWTVPVSLLTITSIPPALRLLASVFLPLSLLLMAVLPFRSEDEGTNQVFDFFYSLIVFQLVVVLILGSIAAMRVTDNQYFQAVVLTVLAFAAALFILAVLWGPRTGFGGLRTYFSRYLMSVGMPFELWMRRIAELSEEDLSSARFLERTLEEIEKFPWITGCVWTSPDGPGRYGQETAFDSRFKYHQLEIIFYTEIRMSPAMFLHMRLLAQVVGEFYEGKRREQVMKQNAYMQAVHETGARLTHDMKNLLQSLYALTSASAHKPDEDRSRRTEYEAMLARQLPQLAKRLQSTLDKLQNPALGAANIMVPADDWWEDVLARHAGDDVNFVARRISAEIIPSNLFDTVLENCLENARRKKLAEQSIEIRVEINVADDAILLTVTDTGSVIPSHAADELLRSPIANSRRGGYGIGLYQAYRQAEEQGYRLALKSNLPGEVCFELLLEKRNLKA